MMERYRNQMIGVFEPKAVKFNVLSTSIPQSGYPLWAQKFFLLDLVLKEKRDPESKSVEWSKFHAPLTPSFYIRIPL